MINSIDIKKSTNELYNLLVESNEFTNKDKSRYDLDNTWIRRYFRCFLDGSYLGEDQYKLNLNLVKSIYLNNKKDSQKLRPFVINQFKEFIKLEFKLGDATILNTIKKAFNYTSYSSLELNTFTNELIEDIIDIYYLNDEDVK